MFLILIKKYWFEIAIALMVIAVLGYINVLNNEIESLEKDKLVLQSEVNAKKAYIISQNISIALNRADYKAAMDRLPTVLHEIETRYKTQYQTIYQWRDNNETHDCNSSMQYLNAFNF